MTKALASRRRPMMLEKGVGGATVAGDVAELIETDEFGRRPTAKASLNGGDEDLAEKAGRSSPAVALFRRLVSDFVAL
jgi:hypothetical protein